MAPGQAQERTEGSTAAPTGRRVLLSGPLLGLHLLLVAVLVGTGVAGWWQWQAWQAEQRQDAAARADRDPVPLADVLGADEPLANEDDGIPVEVTGTYAPDDEQLLVSGREVDGRSGSWVLTPLLVSGSDSALLVVRGWTPEPEAPPPPPGEVRETGVLTPSEPGSGEVRADGTVDAVRVPALVDEVGTDLYDAFLVRTGDGADGLVPVDPVAPDPGWSAGLRNLAYALQWWAFGLFGLFWWWRVCADRLSVASAA